MTYCPWCDQPTKPTGRPYLDPDGVEVGRLCPECSSIAGDLMAVRERTEALEEEARAR